MTDPKSGIISVVGPAAEMADKLATLGCGYQALTESLMYDEHGVHCLGTALDTEGDLDWLVPDAKHLKQSQEEALRGLDAINAASIVRKLKEQGSDSSAGAMERLWQAVSKVLRSTDLGTPEGRADAEGLSTVFGADFYDLHRAVVAELDRLAGEPVKPRADSHRSLARPLASTDDGDLAVGPGYLSEEESEEFIETVANEIRRGWRGLTEVAPRTFLPNATTGQDEYYPITGVQLMQLYVKPVTLFVGCMSEVAAAWLEDQLLYNTTGNDDQAVGDMITAVCWLGGERLGVF